MTEWNPAWDKWAATDFDDFGEDEYPNEHYVTCDQGHEHWGVGGAAGLMLHHQDPTSGTHRYLMQQRGPLVDHGGTWAPPSGALDPGEHPINGAVREAQEELGPFQSTNHQIAHTNDHGGWAFHTVTADTPHMFEPELDDESQDAAWLTPEEIDEMPLHPGFRSSWADLRPPTQQKFASGENPYYHVAPTSVRDQFQQIGPQQFNPAENPAWGEFPGVSESPGFYAWNTLPAAQTYRERLMEQRGGESHDIWQVNVHPSWWDADPEFDGDRDAEREYGGQSLVYRGDQPLTDYQRHSGISGEVVPPPEDDTEEPDTDEQGNPIIDHLTLSSVAHNLHYKSEQGPLTVQEAYQYAEQLLSMMGVKDPGAPGQALHAWLQLYPGDQQMSQGPAVHSIESAVSAPAVPALYHWTDAANLHQWMDPATTGPGSTYLTEHGNAPGDDWNPDVPQMANPVRLTIDHSQLDPQGWDEQYHGWLNNYLYHGVIPPEAVTGIKAFPAPDTWDSPEHWAKTKASPPLSENEGKSTEPQEVMNPWDRWPDFGEQTDDQKTREIQYGDSSTATI